MDQKASASKVATLTESANYQYGLKNFEAAAELYSRAAELQDEVNGEMAPENANLLYLYGRCLYKLAVSKTDVLGAKVAGEDKSKKSKASKGEGSSADGALGKSSALPTVDEQVAETVVEAAVEAKDGMKPAEVSKAADKPYFSITGDDNWDTDSDEEEEGGEGAADGEEDDDMSNAYEILDMARVILQKKLEEHIGHTNDPDGKGKGKAIEYPGDVSDPVVRSIKEQLAEILNVQADISLESDRAQDAVPDNQATLALRKEFLPAESALIAESHFKLSLALEFASNTAVRDAENEENTATEPPEIDEDLRKESAIQTEHAIASCQLRIKKEEEELASLDGEPKTAKQKDIKEVKEMIEELEQRLEELRASPIQIPNLAGPAAATDANPLGGLLGSILGESPAQQKMRIEEATKGANDLSGMVRKKKAPEPETNSKGKRKLHDDDAASDTSKKAKVEDAPDAEA